MRRNLRGTQAYGVGETNPKPELLREGTSGIGCLHQSQIGKNTNEL
jgi:hypothetical protein